MQATRQDVVPGCGPAGENQDRDQREVERKGQQVARRRRRNENSRCNNRQQARARIQVVPKPEQDQSCLSPANSSGFTRSRNETAAAVIAPSSAPAAAYRVAMKKKPLP